MMSYWQTVRYIAGRYKQAATKKAPMHASELPPQGDAAAAKVAVDAIEEPVPGVTAS
jgi:hypothetical protein